MTEAYTIAIHVPLYVDGPRCYAASEWYRALQLLRDSFEGHFNRFIVVAPTRPAEEATAVLEPIGEGGDGFVARASIPLHDSKRAYWLGGRRRQWRADVAWALEQSAVAHTGLGDLYRPINRDALEMALRLPITTVFVRDTDEVTKFRDLMAAGLIRSGPDRTLYLWYYVRTLRRAVKRAELSLLKGEALFNRYAPHARNPRTFHDTSYRSSEIISAAHIDQRLAARSETTPLRLVYCGRLVPRKGCDHSIDIVASARAQGANVTLDLIGSGPDAEKLSAQANGLGLNDAVRFLGEHPYGPELLQRLAGYDGLLFTPLSEDTPRMIFDGYAAGLPLLGYEIPYVKERATHEGAAVLLPFGDIKAAARVVAAFAGDQSRIAGLAHAARKAAQENATDVWYRRRAEWTLQAHTGRMQTS